ncbi:MAG: glycosyltransferase family 4 protein [Clostridia bacterium]|nr:glycosyltransferase family 4 protein [Clostridia bacterium]
MRFLLVSPKNRTVYNFRGELIKLIVSKGCEVFVTGPNTLDVDRIEALGAHFVEIPMDKNGTSIRGDMRYCAALTALMREIKPDVTLSYTVKPVIYGAIAAKRAGVKNVNCLITGAGYTFSSGSRRAKMLGLLVRRLYRYGLGKADRVIFQNPDDRDEFISRHLVKADKCRLVNGSGVDLERFSPVPLPDKPVFFMLSRILKSKGVAEYLEAARLVKRAHPEARFMLLGKYEPSMQDALDVEYVEAFIRDGIVERFDETYDVRPYYAMCSVFVLPSYREGTPRTVLEAMAMGRPVITTQAPGCRETVIEGKNGFLVPVKDIAALADRMCRFIDEPELIGQMGSVSRAYAEEKYDSRSVNAEMLRHMRI